MVDGTCPLKTVVACFLSLLRNKVRPMDAANWSTEGLVLTVTRTLFASFSLVASSFLGLSIVLFYCLFLARTSVSRISHGISIYQANAANVQVSMLNECRNVLMH